jgi:hypothetical protein
VAAWAGAAWAVAASPISQTVKARRSTATPVGYPSCDDDVTALITE